ncbi:hypoxanthine phosphoribosyltransferase [Halothermothrix orenii H 168]|uniref:Hypoxanthine phosphoribosyltransferase n=2 Tax=Halothermothrix orenii TaxID=31909 RepID=B8D064_HALOH|nr:hypoxanthine phosphoribosyltransferase [Halothermothrix orenii H 168]
MPSTNIMMKDIKEIIIPEEVIQNRIKELGEEISNSYDPEDEVIMVCILRGAVIFAADLARHINLPVTIDFMDVSSYGQGTSSSGVVRIIKDLEENIENKHVLIVEDIIDTGLTLKHVVDMLKTREPASIKIVTLLDKPERRVEKQVEVDFNGFEVPDKFVVGYGLDYAEKYRNLPFIGVLKEELYS